MLGILYLVMAGIISCLTNCKLTLCPKSCRVVTSVSSSTSFLTLCHFYGLGKHFVLGLRLSELFLSI